MFVKLRKIMLNIKLKSDVFVQQYGESQWTSPLGEPSLHRRKHSVGRPMGILSLHVYDYMSNHPVRVSIACHLQARVCVYVCVHVCVCVCACVCMCVCVRACVWGGGVAYA